MARHKLIATRDMRYGTRMLRAGEGVELDGPKARLFTAMGWAKGGKRARRPQLDHDGDGREGGSKRQQGDDLATLRAEYHQAVGKRAFNGWDAATLREKIAAARQ